MNNSMINAMVSMGGLQQKLDLLADNIANSNTVGYKRKDASFEDLLTNLKQQSEGMNQPVRLTPLGFNQGWGSRLTMIQPDMSQGAMQMTDQMFDLAIQGNALFEVQTDDAGNRAYTRNGAFKMSFDEEGTGYLTTNEGYTVIAQQADGTEGRIVLPADFDIRVSASGRVTGVSPDGFTTVELGQVKLVQPMKPGVLSPAADNLFILADGLAVEDVVRVIDTPAENDISLLQGFVEQSNVTLTQEMAELMVVQRAYQMSARVLTSSDTMMGLANSLRA